MTSNEAIQELYNEREYLLGEKVNSKTKNWHNDITHYDNIGHCLLTIREDLDRLEKLEKENQELKERYKHRAETSNDLCKAVNQYEKAIEIFRKICSLNNNKTLETERCFLRLTEEEYSLLKEVFGNE